MVLPLLLQETARMVSTKERYVYDRSQFGS